MVLVAQTAKFFDARTAKLIKPKEHLLVDGFLGLRLIATATKKTWTYRFKDATTGLMKQQKIGSWPRISVDEAKVLWQKMLDKREAGEDIIATKKIEKLGIKLTLDVGYTLHQLIEDFAVGHLNKMRKPVGAKNAKALMINSLEPYLDLPTTVVNRRFVFDLIESLSSTPTVAKNVKSQMAAAFELGLNSGRIDDSVPNWFSQVKIKTLRSKGAKLNGVHKGLEKRNLKNHEIKLLLEKDFPLFAEQVQDFLTIQLWTCVRGAEVVQMRVKQFTQEEDGFWWTLPKVMTKNQHKANATALRVPLVGKALEIVQKRIANNSDWLFPKVMLETSEHQTQHYMANQVAFRQPYCELRPKEIRTRLTVTNWSPHDLRRTGRTLLSSLKCPFEIGEAILGHIKTGVHGLYDLYEYDSERRQWLTVLDKKLESIIRD
jgi:integrase